MYYQRESRPIMWQNNGPALWLDAKQQNVVPEGDPRAAFLLVGAGGSLPEEEARKWRLDDKSKAKKSAPANKAKEEAPPNKRS